MKEKQLTALVVAVIREGLAALSNTTKVVASYQPVQQGVATTPTIYIFKIGPDKRYGFLKRSDKWDAIAGVMVHSEIQVYESTYQISGLVIQDPAILTGDTAADLCETVASIINGDVGRQKLQDAGVGILRITNVRNPPFSDDRDRFEFSPNFDFTLTHQDVRLSQSPVVTAIEVDIKRV